MRAIQYFLIEIGKITVGDNIWVHYGMTSMNQMKKDLRKKMMPYLFTYSNSQIRELKPILEHLDTEVKFAIISRNENHNIISRNKNNDEIFFTLGDDESFWF